MGWLGGLGRGMQGYAGMLGEQRKMEWQANQQQLQFERQMNLENLRMQNNTQLKQMDINARTQENQLQREFTAEQNRLTREGQLGYLQKQDELARGRQPSNWVDPKSGKMIDNATYNSMSDQEKAKLVSQKDYELDLADEKLSRALKQKITADQTQRDAAAQSIIDVYGDDPVANAIAKATRAGIDPKTYFGTSGKGISADMIKQAREALAMDEEFATLPLNQQLQMIRDVASGFGGAKGGGMMAMPGEDNKATREEKINLALSSKEEAQKAMQQDDFTKLPQSIQQAIMKVGNAMPGQQPKEQSGPSMMSKIGSGIKSFAQRNVAGEGSMGRNQALQAYKKARPGMTDMFYESSLERWAEREGIKIK